VDLRSAQASPTRHVRTRWHVPSVIRAPRRDDVSPPACQPTPQTTPRQDLWGAWHTRWWWHTNGGEHRDRGGSPSRMGGEPCQSWKANVDARGGTVADMGIGTACQQAATVAVLPVLAAAGQHTLQHPIHDADRLAAYRAAAGGPLLADAGHAWGLAAQLQQSGLFSLGPWWYIRLRVLLSCVTP